MKNKIIYGLPAVIMLTAFYTFLSYAISANSDNMSSLLIAKDIAAGNYRLDGWAMSTQSYLFSDIAWTAIAIKIIGYSPSLAHTLPSLMYSLMTISLIYMSIRNHKFGWIWLLPVVIFPTFFSGSVSFELNVHIGIYLFSCLTLLYLELKDNEITFVEAALFAVVGGLMIDSDKLYMYIFTLPLIISACVQALVKREEKYLKLLSFG